MSGTDENRSGTHLKNYGVSSSSKLLSGGVLRDAEVERALRTVPRHLFLPAIPVADAYSDNAIPTH